MSVKSRIKQGLSLCRIWLIMNSVPKRVLLVVELETAFQELLRVARLLLSSGRYQPIFCFYNLSTVGYERFSAACDQHGIPYVLFDHGDKTLQGGQNGSKNVGQFSSSFANERHASSVLPETGLRLRSRIKNTWPKWITYGLGFPWYSVRNTIWLVKARRLLLEIKPALVVVPEDGIGGNRAIIKMAKEQQIPVVVVPYEYSQKRQPAEAIKSLPNYEFLYGMKNPINRLIARWLPQWIYDYGGECLLRDTGASVLIDEWMGLAPCLPWVVHGGQADCIAVESEQMRQHYLNEGLPANKLVLTGALSDDALFETKNESENRRSALSDKLKLMSQKRLVLCSIPPDHVASRPVCDFNNYCDLLSFWIDGLLALQGTEVIFQLHPRVTFEQAECIANRGGMIVHDNIAGLIPLCDILVTSVSSIIRLAISCGKPVVNYDVYRFGYTDYAEAEGVLTFQERDEFSATVQKLIEREAYYNEIVERQMSCSARWGILDGKVGDRFLAMFDGLTFSEA